MHGIPANFANIEASGYDDRKSGQPRKGAMHCVNWVDGSAAEVQPRGTRLATFEQIGSAAGKAAIAPFAMPLVCGAIAPPLAWVWGAIAPPLA